MQVTLVDAFTRAAGDGNRAGVVVDGGGLDEPAMQAAARKVAVSETAFVLGQVGEVVRLRYFTPAVEIAFCGHATVATAHRLAELGRLEVPGGCVVDCPAGRLELELEAAGAGPRVWLTTPLDPWRPSPLADDALFALLGGAAAMRDPSLPLAQCGTKLFVPLARRAALWALSPAWDRLAALAPAVLGIYAFTRDALEPGAVSHGRYFTPAQGVREDPVTGSASGPLADYLVDHGVLAVAPGAVVRARAEQGDAMGKPGRVELEVALTDGGVRRVRIGGVAVTVLDGTLA